MAAARSPGDRGLRGRRRHLPRTRPGRRGRPLVGGVPDHLYERWATLGAEVSVHHAGHSRQLRLRREPSGRWLADGRELEACRGALDVDLGVTPSTNTSAIRRLGLAVGASAELTLTWVRFPQLAIEPLPQRYTRLGERTYLYESLHDGVVVFHARLEVDGTGLVERYQGLFERID